MDPQINTSSGEAQLNTTGGTDTFTQQVVSETNVTPDAFAQNQAATSQHNRRLIYYIVWASLVIFLLLAVGGGSYILWRNRQGIANNLGVNSLFRPTNIDLQNNANLNVGNGNGLLTVNGSELINGDLTVTGNANIGGTVVAGLFQGDGSGLTNIQSSLPPFVAFTNKNNQLFFGNSQLFKNTTDSTTALQVQQANGSSVFSVDTANNKGKFNNGLEVGNIANLQGSIFNDPFFGIGGNIYKNFAIASELTNNQPGVTYTGMGTEFLINPQNDPISGGNLFAASYSGAKIAQGNAQNYITVAGNLSSLVHDGSGVVQQAVGQVSIVGNEGSGLIGIAANSSYSTTLSGSGNIFASTGALTLNPSILSTTVNPQSTGVVVLNSGLTAGNCKVFKDIKTLLGQPPTCVGVDPYLDPVTSKRVGQQVGLSVFAQDASTCVFPDPACSLWPWQTSSVNVNIYSQGAASSNYVEGIMNIGVCSPLAVSLLEGCVPFTSAASGPRLVVNTPTSGYGSIQPDVVTQLYSASSTNKVLSVRGASGQTADLTEWQDSAGTVLDRVTASGAIGVGQSPTNKFDVSDTSDDTPASFTGLTQTCTVDTSGFGGWSCSSDARLKQNIIKLDGGLDAVMQLNGVTYNFKSNPDSAPIAGFIAQEVQKVLPGLVTTLQDGTLSLNKDGMLPYLVEAVKTENGKLADINTKLVDQGIVVDSLSDELKKLADQVGDHETRIKVLELQNSSQEARIEKLEQELNQTRITPSLP